VAFNLGVTQNHSGPDVEKARSFFLTVTGKKVKVLVFAKGEKLREAGKAGADHVWCRRYGRKDLRRLVGF